MDTIESPAQSGGLLGRLGCVLLGSSWKTTVTGFIKGGALIAISCPELLAGRWDKGELIKGILFFITGSAAIVDGRLQKDHDK
jgi:hypothetical protein